MPLPFSNVCLCVGSVAHLLRWKVAPAEFNRELMVRSAEETVSRRNLNKGEPSTTAGK
jgi:hypothetical protein